MGIAFVVVRLHFPISGYIWLNLMGPAALLFEIVHVTNFWTRVQIDSSDVGHCGSPHRVPVAP